MGIGHSSPPRHPALQAAPGLLYVCLAMLFGAGCGSRPNLWGRGIEVRAVEGGGMTALVRGEWNDVHPAVEGGVLEVETAILAQDEASAQRMRYRLRTITAEPATLVFERKFSTNLKRGPIQVTARVGHFGDSEREASLLRAVGGRLRALDGVDSRPLPQ